jgi:signal transduction histidine kinase
VITGLPEAGIGIEVRDHGPGVPAAQLPLLAEAFYRPDSARSRSAGGVGLGLYLCRLIAQAHGGQLTLANAQPGLRVRVTLPAATAA